MSVQIVPIAGGGASGTWGGAWSETWGGTSGGRGDGRVGGSGNGRMGGSGNGRVGGRSNGRVVGGGDAGIRMRRIGFDRVIDTDMPIPGTRALPPSVGWGAGNDGRGDGAISICRSMTPLVRTDTPPIWSLAGDALHFAAPGVADYRCTPARIDVTPTAGAQQDMVEALLIATALPAVLWLQGDFMLHAAAVIPPDWGDGALAIAGPSGSGKSRLAAGFLARGAYLVADDSVAVRRPRHADATAPRCAGLAGGYHLPVQGGASTRAFHPVADRRARRAARLAAVVVLDDGSHASRTRLGAVAAVEALLANRHRASVPRLCGLDPRALRDAAWLARTVPVYRWPRDDADALLDDAIRRTIPHDDHG